jgi:PAS domain S-box-containing protein
MTDSKKTKPQLREELQGLRLPLEELQKVEAESQQAAEQLRESEELFRQMAENMTDVFWLSDPELTRIFYVSPAYEKVWGRSCASLYADPKSFMAPLHVDDSDRVFAALEEFRQGTWSTESYIPMDRSDGYAIEAFPSETRPGRSTA